MSERFLGEATGSASVVLAGADGGRDVLAAVRRSGFRIILCGDDDDAIEAARSRRACAAIVDVREGGPGAAETLFRLRRDAPGLRAILVVASIEARAPGRRGSSTEPDVAFLRATLLRLQDDGREGTRVAPRVV